MGLWVAEYDTVEGAIAGVRGALALGLRRVDACAPFPSEELEAALGLSRPPIAASALLGAVLLSAALYVVQWWTAAVDYPLDVGGRPLHAVPAFVPITVEMVFLGGALGAFLGGLASARLPRWWHPLFEVEGFDRATRDRWFVVVDDRDPRFDAAGLGLAHRDALVVRRWEGP